MSRVTPAASSEGERRSLYEEITGQIIAELEAGRIPWVQPWGRIEDGPSLGMPLNAATGRRYSGVNILILWGAVFARGYSSQAWLTFRQAQALGGSVRRGERGITVVYADRFRPQEERRRASEGGDEARSIAFLKRFTVFSVDQCDGLPDELIPPALPAEVSSILPEVEALIRRSCADMRIGGDRAFYAPTLDYIQVPRPEAFFDPVNWHRTALHELGHWSGAPHRLARDLTGQFGSAQYAREVRRLHLRLAWRHPDGSIRRLHRRLAPGPEGRQPRHRASGVRRVEGRELPPGVQGRDGRQGLTPGEAERRDPSPLPIGPGRRRWACLRSGRCHRLQGRRRRGAGATRAASVSGRPSGSKDLATKRSGPQGTLRSKPLRVRPPGGARRSSSRRAHPLSTDGATPCPSPSLSTPIPSPPSKPRR